MNINIILIARVYNHYNSFMKYPFKNDWNEYNNNNRTIKSIVNVFIHSPLTPQFSEQSCLLTVFSVSPILPKKILIMWENYHFIPEDCKSTSRSQTLNIAAQSETAHEDRITRFSRLERLIQRRNHTGVRCVNKNISLQYFISPIRK